MMNTCECFRKKLEEVYHDYPEFISRKDFADSIDRSNRTLANLDSKGTGVSGALKINGFVYYPKHACIEWIITHSKVRDNYHEEKILE